MALASVTIKIDVGPIGHAFVTLNDGNGNTITKGYYPDNGLPVGPGVVQNDADYKHTGLEHPYDWSKTIYVSKDQYDAMVKRINQIEGWTQDQYGLFGNNCAGFVKDVLNSGGVNYPHGGVHPISLTMDPALALLLELGDFLNDILSPIENIAKKVSQATTIVSPIILDLDGDGVETTAVKTGTYFDFVGDGFAEQTGWVGKDDGLLVRDLNGDGQINTGKELFGSQTQLANGTNAANGFVALAELDGNHDGKINASDAAFTTLKIWKDVDGDGHTDAGELLSLNSAGVLSINVGYRSSSITVDANGNQHKQIGSYTTTAGKTYAATDVWFKTDVTYSIATEWLDVPADIAVLPDAAGYGKVYDLHQAMVRDTALKGLVIQFTQASTVSERETLVRQIIYKWAGVENIAPGSRGANMDDARKLEALEQFMGEEWYGFANSHDPLSLAAPVLQVAWTELFTLVYGQLMAQSHLEGLFDKIIFTWDEASQTLKGDLSQVATTIASDIGANRAAGMAELGEFIRSIDGMGAQDTLDLTGFATVLSPLGDDVVSLIDNAWATWGTEGIDTLSGDAGSDVIFGGNGDDTLNGNDGDDRLSGGGGADKLDGGNGNDMLDGGQGNDMLTGGLGNDVYRFGLGDGQDLIKSSYDSAVTRMDVLEFKAGVSASAVKISRSGDSLVLTLAGTTDKVTVERFFSSDDPANTYNPLQQIRFADGTVWSLADIVTRMLSGTGGNDSLVGTVWADTINGGAGSDTLDGRVGNDTLDGGQGDDTLTGGLGNDVYRFGLGDGQDLIKSSYDSVATRMDVLEFKAGVSASAVKVSRSGDSLVLTLAGTTDKVTVENFVYGDDPKNTFNPLQQIRFADGTVWSLADIVARMLSGTGGDDSLVGTVWADTINGGAGSDMLDGRVGDDVINGGDGADKLYGGAGNDRIDGGSGWDTMVGGTGDDIYFVDDLGDLITEKAGEGVDTVFSSSTCYLSANVENLTLTGTSSIRGVGNDLNNVLVSNGVANTLEGGAGDDTYYVGAGDTIYEYTGAGTDTVFAGVNWTLSANLENLILTGSAAINGTGNSLANQLTGNRGNNVLNGGAGADTMAGGEGDDTYVVDNLADLVIEAGSNGIDAVQSSVTYTLAPNLENLTLTGYSAVDGFGNDLSNTLTGNSSNNTLTGGGGNDRIDGGSGSDTLVGGMGDDVYFVDASSDKVIENAGEGTDTVNATVSVTLGDNLENLVLNGYAAFNGTGNALNNYLRGSIASNTLKGEAGNDLLEGGDGYDTLTDTSGTAYMNGGTGGDTLTGGTANELFIGGGGSDTITTGNGADIIVFNRGDGVDNVYGGTGTDNTLTLGGGIRYADLTLSKSFNDLILNVGNSEQVVFKNWYVTSANNKSVANLQLILDATADYSPGSGNALYDNKVEQFDFAGMVAQFDQARAANMFLSNWALTNALTSFHLGGSNTAALGGDLAYWYGKNGNLTGMNVSAAQDVINAAGFGSANQNLRAFTGISGAMSTLG
ncbi:MAG: calcium-binding protein [Gallionellaceae bacterium]|nr:calcium-binding protein [Gallionellaceae bacterium]